MIIKHLYQRTITRNGKKVKAWYYWFYDKDGKQVRKSCGSSGKPCLLKREAEAFLANLSDRDITEDKTTLEDFCKGMFDTDSLYLKKYFAKGHELSEGSIEDKKRSLNLILDKYGKRFPETISTAEVDDWLLSFDRSNSWRNQVLKVFKEIYGELYTYNKIDTIPLFTSFALNNFSERGILTIEEIKRLFPDNPDELVKIWRWKTKSHEPDWQIYSFATMMFTALSTGMRKGEIRALKYSQFIADNAILINCRLDQKNREITKLKKGTDANKRWRVTVLPEKTVKMIKYLTEHRLDVKQPYVFTYHGHPYSSTHLHHTMKEVLDKNGIDTEARNISMHSWRFTYNTIMKTQINNIDLRLMLGHLDESMTEYYDKSQALDHLPELLKNQDVISKVFNLQQVQ